ncbi:MAG TPA: universal stress protein [Gemmatimonadaceae bacterium]|nr:universal stress protein [Gemmatimonadaceae bacterium]
MYKRILVPLDGSPFAEHALPVAIAISSLTSAALHLVRVHEPSSPTYTSRGQSDLMSRQHELEYLHTAAARAIANGAHAVATALVEGWPPSAIEREIARTGADLVVLTDHGRTGRGTRCLGSVADTVARHAKVPVLIMRASDRAVDLAWCPLFRNVLIAIDDAESDAVVADAAERLGTLGTARYTLFHMVHPALAPVHSYAFAAAPTTLDAATTRARLSSTRHGLAELASHMRHRAQPNGIDIAISIDTHAATSILDAAAASPVDLVAMSTRASDASHPDSGSVAEQVACSTPLPILMCPTFECDPRTV